MKNFQKFLSEKSRKVDLNRVTEKKQVYNLLGRRFEFFYFQKI